MVDEMGTQGDIIGIYQARSVGKWACLLQVTLDSAETEDIKFSRDGSHLVVWDSASQCGVKVLQIVCASGEVKAVKEVVALEPYQSGSAPGVSKLVMSNDRQYIAAGYHD